MTYLQVKKKHFGLTKQKKKKNKNKEINKNSMINFKKTFSKYIKN